MNAQMKPDSPDTPAAPEMPALPKIEPWSVEQLRAGLVSAEHNVRVHALAMSVQPNTPVDEMVAELSQCVDACRADAIALQVAAVALGNVKRPTEREAAANTLATLATSDNALAVKIFAAHGFAQMGIVPTQSWLAVCQMLFDADATLRQVALRAVTPVASHGAAVIAQFVAGVPPEKWTTEGLSALALSARSSPDSIARVEQFVMRLLKGQALFPAGVAGYAALARLNPSGVAPQALAKIAAAEDEATALAAITTLSQLGESASQAIPGLVDALSRTESSVREEALCRALLSMRISARDVPLQRTMERIERGPDRSVAAHALLLSMHAKAFGQAAAVVAFRHSTASVALRPVLNELHCQLSGAHLTEPSRFATSPTAS
jgi:hypothetical protein